MQSYGTVVLELNRIWTLLKCFCCISSGCTPTDCKPDTSPGEQVKRSTDSYSGNHHSHTPTKFNLQSTHAFKPRMHSSRMRTGRSLTVCPGALPSRGVLPFSGGVLPFSGGCFLLGGASFPGVVLPSGGRDIPVKTVTLMLHVNKPSVLV